MNKNIISSGRVIFSCISLRAYVRKHASFQNSFFSFKFFSRLLPGRIDPNWNFFVEVPGVDVVLQQEADLRKLQQQFRPVPQEQITSQRLAPWELAEQRRLLQEQPSSQKLAPWEVAEQRRLLQEQQRLLPDQPSNEKLAPWEVAEQRRVQQEQLRLQQEEQQRLQVMH
jgi:hypothetical protein